MDRATFEKIKEEHDTIHKGREGRWFDPGEYEDLIKRFFLERVPQLLQEIENRDTEAKTAIVNAIQHLHVYDRIDDLKTQGVIEGLLAVVRRQHPGQVQVRINAEDVLR